MPVYYERPRSASFGEGKPAPRYRLSYEFIGADVADEVNATRIYYARHRDEMLAFQKECGAHGDKEGAKFFKDEARDALRHYRAACLLLPWVSGDLPGDCPEREPFYFPEELFGALEFVSGVAIVRAAA